MPKKKVEIIKPQEQKKKKNKKYNVCAYARVSTGAEEQKDSFVNQQKFYVNQKRGIKLLFFLRTISKNCEKQILLWIWRSYI